MLQVHRTEPNTCTRFKALVTDILEDRQQETLALPKKEVVSKAMTEVHVDILQPTRAPQAQCGCIDVRTPFHIVTFAKIADPSGCFLVLGVFLKSLAQRLRSFAIWIGNVLISCSWSF